MPSILTSAAAFLHGRRPRDPALAPAFVASALVHVAALTVLVAGAGIARPGSPASWKGLGGTLEVVLSLPKETSDAARGKSVPAAAQSGELKLGTSQQPANKPAVPDAPSIPATQGEPAGSLARGLTPRIVVSDDLPRARFGEFADGEEITQFPREVESPVRLPGNLVVPYPSAALAARLEGTVLVWVIVDPQGAIEETHIVEGAPELAEAVRKVLADTHFIPARNEGRAIRFYATLAFDFRIEAGSGTSAPVASRR